MWKPGRYSLTMALGVMGLSGCSGSSVHVAYVEAPPPTVVVAQPAPMVVESPGVVAIPVAPVQVGAFYAELQPYGQWVMVAGQGQCWVPAGITPGWRPYTLGHWVYTDHGWTWMSDEPFGWATYHYGRWTMASGYGWVWVPGTVWGPAWVAWRRGGGYMGWAPLPPGGGVDVVVVSEAQVAAIAPSAFFFVEARFVSEPHVHRHAIAVERNTTIINQTTNITNITVVNKKVVNQSITVNEVERATGKKVERTTVKQVADIKQAKETMTVKPRPTAPPKTVPPVVQPPKVVPPVVHPPKVVEPAKIVPPKTVEPVRTVPPVVHPPKVVEQGIDAKRQQIEANHAQMRQQMLERHGKELKNLPAGTTAAEVTKRHEAERVQFEQKFKQELETLRK